MKTGLVRSTDLGNDWTARHHLEQPWAQQHNAALASPSAVELPLVTLLSVIQAMVKRYSDDYVLRQGIAHLLMGTADLLNGEWGRLDMGTVSSQLNTYAERISFSLDIEEFTD